jgi:hypothetical protein
MGLGGEWSASTFTARLNSYNAYLSRPTLNGDDIVLFVDAYDTLFFGGEDEIVRSYIEVERDIAAASGHGSPMPLVLFNAEPSDGGVFRDAQVASARAIQERLGVAPSAWQHLNAGVVIGRARALHWLFNRTFNDALWQSENITKTGAPDQEWLQKMLLKHPSRMSLDYTGKLLCVAHGLGGLDAAFNASIGPALASAVTFDEKRRRVKWTPHAAESGSVAKAPSPPVTTFPAVVHFPGAGHWTRAGDHHCVMVEAARRRYPIRLAALGFRGTPTDWEAACGMLGADAELAQLGAQHSLTRALIIALVVLGLCCAGSTVLSFVEGRRRGHRHAAARSAEYAKVAVEEALQWEMRGGFLDGAESSDAETG